MTGDIAFAAAGVSVHTASGCRTPGAMYAVPVAVSTEVCTPSRSIVSVTALVAASITHVIPGPLAGALEANAVPEPGYTATAYGDCIPVMVALTMPVASLMTAMNPIALAAA